MSQLSATAPSLGELSILNPEPIELPGPCLLHGLVPSSASPAVHFLGTDNRHTAISYVELHTASDSLAAQILRQLENLPHSDSLIIPILSPQTPQLYVSLLAILKAGGAFCPVNVDAPSERIKFILQDVNAKVVLVSRELASMLPTGDASPKIILVDDVLIKPKTSPMSSKSHAELTPESLAYVMYTSGSTGTPKGVGISHRAATQSLLAHDRHIPQFSRFLQFAAPTFDVSVFEIFFPLFRGATLVGCDRANLLTDLPGVMRRMSVDACELTPSVAGSLLRQRSRAPQLRLLLTIGEMLTEPIIEEFGGDETKPSILWGMYGPTEATIHCTLQTDFATSSSRQTIGKPLDTVSVFISSMPDDSTGAPEFDILPVGEIGELVLGGHQLATGYLNRPEQTAKSFISTSWGRLYRTGDKARIRPDGIIECMGRLDDSQVKLNGQRLELGEIEHVLLRTPACHGAFATVISNVLVAFAEIDDGPDSRERLFNKCKSWLPTYMMPADIFVLGRFPQLPSGKLDKKQLIRDYEARIDNTDRDQDEMEDEEERILCEVSSQVLGQPISPSSRLPAFRLDSLTAIQLTSLLRERGVSVHAVDILNVTSLRQLRHDMRAKGVVVDLPYSLSTPLPDPSSEQLKDQVAHIPSLSNRIDEVERLEKCSHLQQAMIAETLKDLRSYINQLELEIPPDTPIKVIHSAFEILTERNEILRTGFAFIGDEMRQIIWRRFAGFEDHETQIDSFRKPEEIEHFLLGPLKIHIRSVSPHTQSRALLLTLHHSIYDGWSMDLITDDLRMLLEGREPPERPQFFRVARQIDGESEVGSDGAMEFWADHLHGCGSASTPNLKSVATPESHTSFASTKLFVDATAVRETSASYSVGPQVIFQACLAWLLGAMQGSDDIVLGCVSSGRALPIAGIDKVLGPCMTTQPLRIRRSQFKVIGDLLQSIQAINRKILRHGVIPLSQIKKAAALSATSALFDVVFAYQESLPSRHEDNDAVREMWHRDAIESTLLVEIQPTDDTFVCQVTWKTDVFSSLIVETLLRHLGSLVRYFTQHPEAMVDSIPSCFTTKSLSHFNVDPKPIETFHNLAELVEDSARRFPSSEALCFADSISPTGLVSQSMSYYGLNATANQIARHLQLQNLTSGNIVAIIMTKSPLLYCSILAIAKAGCAYLPILPSTPHERIDLILSQAKPLLCMVDTASSSLPLRWPSRQIIDMEGANYTDHDSANLKTQSETPDLAYVIYTSGTTGIPKGVAVTNRNILSNIRVLSDIYPHQPSDKMLQACSQAFDVSVFEIFFTWANGMSLCSTVNDTLFEDFESAVRAFGVTHLSLTVTVASLLKPKNVPSVKFLVTSGEPMTDAVLDTWADYLYQGYGPSETTNICTVRKVARGDSSRFLGWAFVNTSVFVLSPESTDIVPMTCVGELCFGGDQVAAGYLKSPELTTKSFIDHPTFGRMYRSGDLGRMLPDGSLVILGRIDTQVKLRGMRIELQEIEAIVKKTGITRACKTMIIQLERTNVQQLALFYIPAYCEASRFRCLPLTPDIKIQIDMLRQQLEAYLPEYMVPTYIFPISALPLTASDKVDERTLSCSVNDFSDRDLIACSSHVAQDNEASAADWSELEMAIADAISQVLKLDGESVNLWTSFSSLGIDSITAIPIARRLRATLQKRIPLTMLLQSSNIKRLATAISSYEETSAGTSADEPLLPEALVKTVVERFAGQGRAVSKILPCTPLQEAMVMASASSATGGRAYYNQMLLKLNVPGHAIRDHWAKMIQRHEILRTCFMTTDNLQHPAVQVILDQHDDQWHMIPAADLGSLDQEVSHLVSMTSGLMGDDQPPLSLAIIKVDDGAEYLSFVCHHAMYDGISMQIVFSEIEATHKGETLRSSPPLEPFLRAIRTAPSGQEAFWREHLSQFEPSPLNQTNRDQDSSPITFSAKASNFPLTSIESQLRGLGVSMLALCQTAWAVTLSLAGQKTDVSFGHVVSGRSLPLERIDDLVAPCFNTLPMRIDLSKATFLLDSMKSLQALNAEMLQFQFTSLRRIHQQLSPQSRLFDTLLILQPQPLLLDEGIWTLEREEGLMDVPLVCEVVPHKTNDTLMVHIHRDPTKFSFDASRLLGAVFSYVLDICLKYPSSHIPMIDTLPSDWQSQLQSFFSPPKLPDAADEIANPTPTDDENWNPAELKIRRVLATLASVPENRVERRTPIWQYGLDSIGAIQLATLLRRDGVNVSAVDVIEHPTCAGIASALGQREELNVEGFDFARFAHEVEHEVLQAGVDTSKVEAILPCTATQQGLLSRFLESEGRLYFNFDSWTLDCEVSSDSQVVVSAWEALVAHRQILRTGFVPVSHEDSSYAMIIYGKGEFKTPLSVHETDSFDLGQWRAEATTNAVNSLSTPPWRAAIVAPRSSAGKTQITMHLSIHHALYDAFTLQLLLRSLSDIMLGNREIEDDAIQPTLSHYFDSARSCQSSGEEFWRQKADFFVSHRFPVMTPLHVESSENLSVSRTCELPSSAMRRMAAKMGVTMQAALQAAWTRLLSAYTGESRVSFGVVFDCRTTDVARRSTLPMINTLPVIAENTSHLLEQMMQYNRELRRYQLMPMTQIQRFLGCTDAMFDTILIYQAGDASVKPLPFRAIDEVGTVEYTISLEVEESLSDSTRLNLAYKANILPIEQADLLLAQFDALLLNLLSSPKEPMSSLPSRNSELYSILGPKCYELPIEAPLLHELVERTAAVQPAATAFKFVEEVSRTSEYRQWTYQQLNDLGNQVANFILGQNVPTGSIVATCFQKCPIAYFTHLGILKAGCALLCLDPTAPASRQRFIIDDSNAALLLCEDRLQWTSEISCPVFPLTESVIASSASDSPVLSRPITPSDTCYCLYTSGTTGTPKGCLISHENTVQAMAAFRDLFSGHWDSSSRWLQFAAFHFDVSVLEQYWSWYVGITVVAVPKDVILSDLTGTITKLGITHIDLTPSLARLTSPEECPSLCRGTFITGGEKLRSDILQTWGSKRVIYNAYGPTEATIGVTMQRRVPEDGRPSNIGNLFPNVGGFVFEPGTETPVLRGGIGELCVSGKLVGKGYLNRNDLTKERFPTLQASGDRIYRTGDLVRVLHDDSLDFLGRADDQVKLRGQRLEIGEINHAIREALADQVGEEGDVTTMVTKRAAQDADLLVSFISLASSSKSGDELQVLFDEQSLNMARVAQHACRDRLSTYMIPTYILCVSYIPLSSNNKNDANRLRKLFSDLSNEQLQAVVTSSSSNKISLSALERVVVDALSRVVRVQEHDIDPTTTIFQLGIDSITAGRLATHLRSAGFASASASLILRHPQIGQLSRALYRPDASTNNDLQMRQSIDALKHRYLDVVCTRFGLQGPDIEYIAPCTPLQEGILARSETSGDDSSAYKNQFQLRINDGVDINCLKSGLQKITASEAILRTVFVNTTEGYLQVALAKRSLRWSEVTPDAGKSLEQIARDRHVQWSQHEGLAQESPFEVDHVESNGKHYLLLRLLHAIYDARSLGLILERLKSEYYEKTISPSPPLISVLYQGPLLSHEPSHPFWQSLLKHHRTQSMPSLLDKPGTSDSKMMHTIRVPGLETRRKELEVTHQTILQAAWLSTMRPYFVKDPTIGIILSGRSLPIDNIDFVVGPLFNTLPLRVDFTDGMTWASLTRRIQEINNGILTFVHTPLRDIQKLCNNGQPIFDTLFTFDREFTPTEEEASGEDIWTIRDSPGKPDYPLAIEVILSEEDTLKVTIVAQSHIADEEALNSVFDRFKQCLEMIIASADGFVPMYNSKIDSTGTENTDLIKEPPTTSPPKASAPAFVWTNKAKQIRHEVAVLAGADEEQVSELTNLLGVGLDSIDIIRLSGRLRKLGYEVSVGRLMKSPTLGSIITSLEEQTSRELDLSDGDKFDDTISILRDYCSQRYPAVSNIAAVLPPTPLQDSMVAEMVLSDFKTYFNHDVLEIPSNVDLERLKSALSIVYSSSPILRTGFLEVDDSKIGSAYLQIVRNDALDIPPTEKISGPGDISAITERARSRAMESKGAAELFQVRFAQAPSARFLVLSISHALYDGRSLHMLHRDIRDAYEGRYIPRPSYEPSLARILEQSNPASQRFWGNLLQDSRPTVLPQIPDTPAASTMHRVERVSTYNAVEIRNLCQRYRVTPQVLIQGCWAAVLASLAKSLDVVFGVVLSGRDTEEAQNLMFPTMNTVPVRIVLHGTVSKYLEYLQDIMSTVIEYQRTPLRDIRKMAKFEGAQLFNTLFLLQSADGDDVDGGDGGDFLKSVQSASAVEYPVCVEIELTGADAIWRVACDESYVCSQDAEKLGSSLEAVLEFFARSPQAEILKFHETREKSVSICGLKPVLLSSQSQQSQKQESATSKLSLPATEEDKILVEVLSEISGVHRAEIDLDKSIFHIGLDSISAIKACSMLRKRGLEVSVRALTSSASVCDVLTDTKVKAKPATTGEEVVVHMLRLDSVVGGSDVSSVITRAGIDTNAVEGVLPATSMQVQTLSVWQASGGSTFFPTFSYRISGSVNLDVVSRAVKSLVDEMAMLRTHFITTTWTAPPYLQVTLKPADARRHALKISESDGSSGRWRFVYAATPFAVIGILGEDGVEKGAVFHFRLHHGLYDAISLPVILNRFAELCGASSKTTSTSVGGNDEGADAAWHEFASLHMAPSVQTMRKAFWASYLDGECASQFLTPAQEKEDSRNDKPTAEFHRDALGRDDIIALRAMSSSHGVSIQALFYAAYAKVFAGRRHQTTATDADEDVVFAIYLANRAYLQSELQEAAPFPTLAILPLRVRRPLAGPGRTIQALAAEIQRDILEIGSRENSTVGLWEVDAWTGVKIDSFVNFLGVSSSVEDSVEEALGGSGDVRLEKLSISIDQTNDDGVIEGPGADLAPYIADPESEGVVPNAVRETYMDSVDIEIALRGDSLDIGVFGSSRAISASEARGVVDGIVGEVVAGIRGDERTRGRDE